MPDDVWIFHALTCESSTLSILLNRNLMGMAAPWAIDVDALPSKRVIPSRPSHHVGAPPISFINPWPSFHKHTPLEAWVASRTNRNFQPVPSSRDRLVKIRTPDWGSSSKSTDLKATWIGHATFLIEAPTQVGAKRGVRVLLDPVFSERTSPVTWAGPKRYTPTPCTLEEIPEIDLVVVSHDHYDHMDSDTLRKIYHRRKGAVHFLVPLGNQVRLVGFGIALESVTQLDWWQTVRVNVPDVGFLTLTCTPSQHFSGRSLFDQGSTLWSSWVLETGAEQTIQKIFFSGDTGFRYVPEGAKDDKVPRCPAFQEIAEVFDGFDLSLLPIGLYSPRHFASSVHCNPEDAICLHKILKSRKTIGMHYGTVRGGLSQYFEEVTEPPRRFQEAVKREGLAWGEEIGLVDVGETALIR